MLKDGLQNELKPGQTVVFPREMMPAICQGHVTKLSRILEFKNKGDVGLVDFQVTIIFNAKMPPHGQLAEMFIVQEPDSTPQLPEAACVEVIPS
jgi:hypothetical protein